MARWVCVGIHSSHGRDSNPRPHGTKPGTVPLGHRVPQRDMHMAIGYLYYFTLQRPLRAILNNKHSGDNIGVLELKINLTLIK